ncbi:glycosyltransferase family 4 protein [Muricauda sp. SCSIO 64092]|uniref:glycosyltransferase family 4 protein n=1 Tax=Allomuricauda sp. SCSIO 64092 TaxID=2908842 RepID=UPI001FF19666|nr:glycosyltransferase family 4 protein [Muricauda sp. SCSIO 64092]UOY06092.1 glycosyltransferase family 4 protein [Muricauda sp. SCSIO 64092]
MDNTKKKIAFVIGSLSSGGAERVISTLSNQLIENFEVLIITFLKQEPFYHLDQRVKVIPCKNHIPSPRNIFQSLRLNYQLVKSTYSILKRENVDLTIGFITSANIIALIAAKLNGIPCMISERNNPIIEEVPKFWRVLRRLLYPKADFVILQTQGVKQYYERLLNPNKIGVLPNPISKELSRLRPEAPSEKKIILTVGRLVKEKNQRLLINAFSNVEQKDWEIQIVGNGNQQRELQSLIAEHGLEGKVTLRQPTKDIAKYYRNAGIFVLTSENEGLPNALIEAMHFGIPSISTNCPFGPSDLIEDGINGFLIPVNDQKALERGLSELMGNKSLRKSFGEKGKITTKEFENDIAVGKWQIVIEQFI